MAMNCQKIAGLFLEAVTSHPGDWKRHNITI
jgi:hypothetical protein